MSESNQGTAVAKREAASWDVGVGALPEHIQHALELRKRAGMVAAQIAQQNWGQRMDLATRRAIAEYGRRFNIDVVTEIHVLGGNIYKNAQYWLRRLSEMVDQGSVEYAYADHVHNDPRLKAFPDEQKRRAWERIQHGIPDEATGAVVFHVKLRSMLREVVGVKWCGTRGRTKEGKAKDPVGDEFPIETAESRAIRRGMRQIASQIPALNEQLNEMDRVEEQLQGAIVASHQQFREQEARVAMSRQVALQPGSDDPYGTTEPSHESETVASEEVRSEGAEDGDDEEQLRLEEKRWADEGR